MKHWSWSWCHYYSAYLLCTCLITMATSSCMHQPPRNCLKSIPDKKTLLYCVDRCTSDAPEESGVDRQWSNAGEWQQGSHHSIQDQGGMPCCTVLCCAVPCHGMLPCCTSWHARLFRLSNSVVSKSVCVTWAQISWQHAPTTSMFRQSSVSHIHSCADNSNQVALWWLPVMPCTAYSSLQSHFS